MWPRFFFVNNWYQRDLAAPFAQHSIQRKRDRASVYVFVCCAVLCYAVLCAVWAAAVNAQFSANAFATAVSSLFWFFLFKHKHLCLRWQTNPRNTWQMLFNAKQHNSNQCCLFWTRIRYNYEPHYHLHWFLNNERFHLSINHHTWECFCFWFWFCFPFRLYILYSSTSTTSISSSNSLYHILFLFRVCFMCVLCAVSKTENRF